MFTVDIPDIPAHDTPVVLVKADVGQPPDSQLGQRQDPIGRSQLTAQAAAPQVAQSQKIPAITLDWPWIVPNDRQYAYKPGRFASDLVVDACSMLLHSSKFKYLKWTSPTCKLVEVVTQPKHGTLINEGNGAYGFKPEPGYLGKDSFKYIVEGIDGRRVLITMPILMKTMAEAFSFNPVSNSSG